MRNLMPEMLVTTPEVKRTLHDYDIIFESGMMIPATIDHGRGDNIEFSDRHIKIHLAPKPSLNNPDHTLPAEDTTIFLNHVVSIQHRVREVTELSPEEKTEIPTCVEPVA
jgi:hypothetical protein